MSQSLLERHQQELPFIEPTENISSSTLGITFRESKTRPIHRWYPYVEGFDADYVQSKIASAKHVVKNLYDPFGGAGTMPLEASKLGIESAFSELNPFMAFVCLTKVNATGWAHKHQDLLKDCSVAFLKKLNSKHFRQTAKTISLSAYHQAFPDRNFFDEVHLRELLAARDLAIQVSTGYAAIRDLLLLAVAANLVHCSHMTRRADLRRRRSDEYKTRVVNTVECISKKVKEIVFDIETAQGLFVPTQHISQDSRLTLPELYEAFDFAITSPPYLNGTNYFRNTKLELWFLGHIESELNLKDFYRRAISGGISNVSKDRPAHETFDEVEAVARVLDREASDLRIPQLVRSYFSDMRQVLSSVWNLLKKNGRFVIDIGDSKFYGVHVPTDLLLAQVAGEVGFEIESNEIIARRHSRDKTPLRQVEITLKKPKNQKIKTAQPPLLAVRTGHERESNLPLGEALDVFRTKLPYKKDPFAKKSWGHPLHSLCSYQGKLKPAVAHWLVRLFTAQGMTVLDPVGGVGTIGLEAALQRRIAVSNDLSPLAAVVAHAKLSPPTVDETFSALQDLRRKLPQIQLTQDDLDAADFGLNAKVKDYFHPATLEEILQARRYFSSKSVVLSKGEVFLKACLLHILHGNRPYALSRTSHSLTPYNPRGCFQYKSLIAKLEERVNRIQESIPEDFPRSYSFNEDFRSLKKLISQPIDRIITSPPFVGMRFDRPNWLRLWFCGWKASDFHAPQNQQFLERQQMTTLDVYGEFFSVCADLLKAGGLMILHLGGSSKYDMESKLTSLSKDKFNLLSTISECVENIERHGIRDKGTTSTHHFLFFEKRN